MIQTIKIEIECLDVQNDYINILINDFIKELEKGQVRILSYINLPKNKTGVSGQDSHVINNTAHNN